VEEGRSGGRRRRGVDRLARRAGAAHRTGHLTGGTAVGHPGEGVSAGGEGAGGRHRAFRSGRDDGNRRRGRDGPAATHRARGLLIPAGVDALERSGPLLLPAVGHDEVARDERDGPRRGGQGQDELGIHRLHRGRGGQREQADQEIERSTNQMEEAKAEARLVEQRELQEQNRAIGDARREVVTVTKEAEQRKVVSVTHAERELEVAKLQLQSAEKQAAAIRSRGEAEANVVLFHYRAKAEPLQQAVRAFGDGTTYAQQHFLQKVAPAIQSILSNTEGPFADIFKQFQVFHRPAKTAAKEGGDR